LDITGRERLLRLLHGEPVDRIPVAPFIYSNFVKAFFNGHEIDVIAATIDVYEHFGFDIIHRNCGLAYEEPCGSTGNWEVEKNTTAEGRDQTTVTTVHTPRGDLRQVFRLAWVSDFDAEATPVEYLIKSPEDLEILMEYMPPVPDLDPSPIRRTRKLLGEKGLAAPWVQGAFNYAAFYFRRLDDLLMDAMLNPEFFHRLMRFTLDRNKTVIQNHIDAGAEVLSYAANIASGKVLNEDFFRSFIFSYEKELIDFIQGQGMAVIYHNCGCAKNLFPCYRDLGMRMYESLTPPPYGDTILEDAFNGIGPDPVLSGNIDQIEFLRTAEPESIRARVREVMDKAVKRGRFILATTDYFHEATPHDSIRTFADAGIEYGRL
jgi:uroporphyrinogen decarboxylase